MCLGSPGAEGSLCVRRWVRGPPCWSWLWLCSARPSPCWGVHQHPPVLAPPGPPQGTQEGRASSAPPRLRQQPGASRQRHGSSPVSPTCGAPSLLHRGDPPSVPGAFGDAAGGSSSPFQQRDRPAPGGCGGSVGSLGALPWAAPRGPHARRRVLPWVAPRGRGASRLRFAGGSAVPAARKRRRPGAVVLRPGCAAPAQRWTGQPPAVRPRGLSVTRSLCPQVPASSCPQMPLSLHLDGPRSLCPQIPAAHCPCIPMSLLSQIPLSPSPRIPRSLCAHFPLSPGPCVPTCPRRPRDAAGRAGSRCWGEISRPPGGSCAGATGPGWGGGFFGGGGLPGARRLPVLRCRPVPRGGAAGGDAPASAGADKGGGIGTGTGRDGPGRAPPALLRRCPARCCRYRAPGGSRGHVGSAAPGGWVLPAATGGWVCGLPPPSSG